MPPLPHTVAVAGAGTMGVGIGCVFALAGCAVRLTARRESTLAEAATRAPGVAESLRASDRAAVVGRLTFTTDLAAALRGADLVIETIVEELDPKLALLETAEREAPGAILVSNTSSLPLDRLAAPLRDPGRFAGLHWFNPPELVPLVEVVATDRTDPRVVETLRDWMAAIGKAPVVLSRDTPGFVANRLQYALLREAWALVEEGVCSYEDVDRAVTHGLGARWASVGPFQTVDLAGLEVHLAVARNLFPALAVAVEPPAALVDAVESGALGVKSGRGLLGAYDTARLQEIVGRRDSVLRYLSEARRPE